MCAGLERFQHRSGGPRLVHGSRGSISPRELLAQDLRHYRGRSDQAIATTLCAGIHLVSEIRTQLEAWAPGDRRFQHNRRQRRHQGVLTRDRLDPKTGLRPSDNPPQLAAPAGLPPPVAKAVKALDLPRRHRGRPAASPVERPGRIDQDQDPLDHPQILWVPLARAADRARHARPWRLMPTSARPWIAPTDMAADPNLH